MSVQEELISNAAAAREKRAKAKAEAKAKVTPEMLERRNRYAVEVAPASRVAAKLAAPKVESAEAKALREAAIALCAAIIDYCGHNPLQRDNGVGKVMAVFKRVKEAGRV